MRETKWYCDVCGKEIIPNGSSSHIPVVKKIGKHGMEKVTLRVMDNRGNFLDFCDDCKATIAILFGGSDDRKAIDEEIERAWGYAETD